MNKIFFVICIPLVSVFIALMVPGVYAEDFLSRWAIPICSIAMALIVVLSLKQQKNSSSKNTVIMITIFGLSVLCMLHITLLVLEKPVELSESVTTGIFIGIVMIILGNFMPRTKPNAAFGLRLPWTLSNEDVWRKSNRFAGTILVAAGIIMLPLSILLPNAVGAVILIVVLSTACIASIVSFKYYKQIVKEA